MSRKPGIARQSVSASIYPTTCSAKVPQFFLADASSSHPGIMYRILDWSDALDPATLPVFTSTLHNDIDADVILGADLVRMIHYLALIMYNTQFVVDLGV